MRGDPKIFIVQYAKWAMAKQDYRQRRESKEPMVYHKAVGFANEYDRAEAKKKRSYSTHKHKTARVVPVVDIVLTYEHTCIGRESYDKRLRCQNKAASFAIWKARQAKPNPGFPEGWTSGGYCPECADQDPKNKPA